jgi:hypothetical protein
MAAAGQAQALCACNVPHQTFFLFAKENMHSYGVVQTYEDERYITQATISNGQLTLVDNTSNRISVSTNYAVNEDKPLVKLNAGWMELATLSANTLSIDAISLTGAISVDNILENTTGTGVTIENVLLKDGHIQMSDGFQIRSGDSNDLQIYHDATAGANLLLHSSQLQFRSSMSGGDSYKFNEIGRRSATFVYSADNATGNERPSGYFKHGNQVIDGVDDSSYFTWLIRQQNNAGSTQILKMSQPGNSDDTAYITAAGVEIKNGAITAEKYKLTATAPAASSSAGTQLGYEGFVKGVGSSTATDSYILPEPVVGTQIWITNNEVVSAGSFVVKVQNADSTTGERINSVLSEVSIPVHHHARFTCVTEDSHNNNRNRCNWICEIYSVNGIGAPGVSEGFRSGARIYTSNDSGAAVKVLKVPQANYTAFVAEVTVHVSHSCAVKESKFIWRVSQCAGAKTRDVSEVWTTTSMDTNIGNRTIASIAGIGSEETIEAVDHEVLTITATHGGAVSFTSDYHVTWRALSMDTQILNYSDPNV